MYNTLNSIAGLVRDQQNEAAVSMIVGLSEFLRRASEDSHRSQVSLAEEVEYLQRYLDIQKVRFGERLQVSVDIPAELHASAGSQFAAAAPGGKCDQARHRQACRRRNGPHCRRAPRRQPSSEVYNDGPGDLPDWQATHTGVGLGNLRTRLQILHGNESELQLRRAVPAGVEVVVTLPLGEA